MALDETILPSDDTLDVQGVQFVYPRNMAHWLEDVEIDLTDSGYGPELVIRTALSGTC